MKSVIIILCASVLPSTCYAYQDSDSKLWLELLSKQPVRFSYPVNLNGYITFARYPERDNRFYSASEFYLHPVVIEELKLSPKKQETIESAFEEYHKKWESRLFDSAKKSNADEQDGSSESLEELRNKLIDQLTRRIDSALTKTQEKRLRQVQLRFLVHLNGFHRTFNDESVRKLMRLAPLDKQWLEKNGLQKIARIVLKEHTAIATETLDRWLSDFEPEQRRVFDERWKHIVSGSTSRQQLILQLDSKLKPTKLDPTDPFNLTSAWPNLRHDAAGGCVVQKRDTVTYKLSALGKTQWIQNFFGSKHFQRDIELVDEQIEEHKELNRQFYERRMEINHVLGKRFGIVPRELNGRIVYTLTTPEQERQFEKAMTTDASLFYGKYMNILLPHQKELLNVVLTNINTRLQGPLAELLWGDLGEILELDDAAKDSLKMKSDEACEHLQAESKRLYDDAMEDLIQLAPVTERSRLRSCLGDEFKTFSPALDGLLVAFFE